MSGKRIGIYPGTFDPITNGHVDIIERGTKLVDHLVVGVAVNAGKNPMFSLEDRAAMVAHELKALSAGNGCSVEVRPFETLLMKFAEDTGASLILRGLRAVSDFDYEFQMAGMNARLNDVIETVFLMASETNQFISSSFVKEIARYGGDISSFVSPHVHSNVTAALK